MPFGPSSAGQRIDGSFVWRFEAHRQLHVRAGFIISNPIQNASSGATGSASSPLAEGATGNAPRLDGAWAITLSGGLA